MATALQAFTNHEFGTIRTITSGGQILFCGRDVAAALGYAITAAFFYPLTMNIPVCIFTHPS